MKASQACIDMIKKFEGCELVAYKPVKTEQYWTIGYGHYGPDVTEGMRITQSVAEDFLRKDLNKFEKAVTATGLTLTQNQFDALVSFSYNCGVGNLKKLVAGRSLQQIADAIPLYNKAGGKTLAGLTRRRTAERALFLLGGTIPQGEKKSVDEVAREVLDGKYGNGAVRKQLLTEAGYDYKEVQDAVNKIIHGTLSN